MWKPWIKNDDYKIPKKPREPNKQLSMIWDIVCNHLIGKLREQDRINKWQERKMTFMFVLLALILAACGRIIFS